MTTQSTIESIQRATNLIHDQRAEIERLTEVISALQADVRTAYAIAGWHECRLAIVRRDGWEALKRFESKNPSPGSIT